MHLSKRKESFTKGIKIDKKLYRWRYTVIPADWLAELGFYFDPVNPIDNKLSKDGNRMDTVGKTTGNSKIEKDAVHCIFCDRRTIGLQNCRSKNKDRLENIQNVLILHLNGDNLNCPIIYLHLKILIDSRFNMGVSNWKDDPLFGDPFELTTRNFMRLTFIDSTDFSKVEISNIVNAGLIKYDLSLNLFNTDPAILTNNSSNDKSLFCIYCKNIIYHNDFMTNKNNNIGLKPILTHLKVSHNGHCYFFKRLSSKFPEFANLDNLNDFDPHLETDASNDSIIHNSLILENIENTRDEILNKVTETTSITNDNKQEITNTKLKDPQIILDENNHTIQEENNNHDTDLVANNSIDTAEASQSAPPNFSTNKVPSPSETRISESSSSTHSVDSPSYEPSDVSEINNTETLKQQDSKRKNDNDKVELMSSPQKNILNQDGNFSSPGRKKRKINNVSSSKTKSQFLLHDSSFNTSNSTSTSANKSNNKDLILNFKDHIHRTKRHNDDTRRNQLNRRNNILDDSHDDISFSEYGNSSFNIPLKSPKKTIFDTTLNSTRTINEQLILPIVENPSTLAPNSSLNASTSPTNNIDDIQNSDDISSHNSSESFKMNEINDVAKVEETNPFRSNLVEKDLTNIEDVRFKTDRAEVTTIAYEDNGEQFDSPEMQEEGSYKVQVKLDLDDESKLIGHQNETISTESKALLAPEGHELNERSNMTDNSNIATKRSLSGVNLVTNQNKISSYVPTDLNKKNQSSEPLFDPILENDSPELSKANSGDRYLRRLRLA